MLPLALGDDMFSLILANWKWVLIAGLLVALGAQQMRVDHAHAETAQVREKFATAQKNAAEAAQKAEEDARAEETRREAEKEKVIDEANAQTAVAQAAAASAADAAASLRNRLALYTAAIRKATSDSGSPSASPSKRGADPLDMLAGVLTRADDTAGELAAYADRLRIAGQACESYADGLQSSAR